MSACTTHDASLGSSQPNTREAGAARAGTLRRWGGIALTAAVFVLLWALVTMPGDFAAAPPPLGF